MQCITNVRYKALSKCKSTWWKHSHNERISYYHHYPIVASQAVAFSRLRGRLYPIITAFQYTLYERLCSVKRFLPFELNDWQT